MLHVVASAAGQADGASAPGTWIRHIRAPLAGGLSMQATTTCFYGFGRVLSTVASLVQCG